jgi:hypothetical protein
MAATRQVGQVSAVPGRYYLVPGVELLDELWRITQPPALHNADCSEPSAAQQAS